MAGRHLDAEGHGRATGETVVLGQVDRLLGQLLHVECPQETRDGEEDFLLGQGDTRADTTASRDRGVSGLVIVVWWEGEDVPGTEHPVVALVGVGEVGGLGVGVVVVDVAVGLF